MKTVIRMFAALSIFSFVACGGNEPVVSPMQPGEVAILFFNSISSGDIDNVRSNVCFDEPAEQAIFDEYLERLFIPAEGRQPRGHKADYVVVSEEILGDTANVELRGMTIAGKNTKIKVRLLNNEGWKVDGSQAVLHRVE
ncbi:MAG: hypothetical protein IJ513_00640 [Bacteroidaceae bacterium]|nr:hypothetical protein [Bacteroidaceae bacterium]